MNQPEESRHWASLEETSLIWGIKIMVWIYRIFGRRVFRLILRPVVSYYFLTGRIARHASMDYLRRLSRSFPELKLGYGWWDSYQHFLSFGETLLDKIVVWMGLIDASKIDFPDRQLLLDLIAQKRGAMLLSGHIGNLEICQAFTNLSGNIQLNILTHTKHAEKFNSLLGSNQGSSKIRLIQVSDINPAVAIDLLDKIESGEFIVMVGDRIPIEGSRTISAKFLGQAADFPQGPYLLATLLRCPVFTLFCYPSHGRFKMHLQPFADSIRIPRTEPQRQQMLESLVRRYAEQLEKHCRAEPLQWFNFYPFWKPSANSKALSPSPEAP